MNEAIECISVISKGIDRANVMLTGIFLFTALSFFFNVAKEIIKG